MLLKERENNDIYKWNNILQKPEPPNLYQHEFVIFPNTYLCW